MGLTAKRRVFVEAYLKCWNGAEAARTAGYAFPRRRASVLLTNGDIKALIQERLAAKALSADEVLTRLGEHARGGWSQYIRDTGTHRPWLDIDQMREDGKLHLIKGFTVSENGNVKVEGYDAQSALVHIAKHLGMFKTRVEHFGPDGGAISIELRKLYKMNDEELEKEYERRVAALLTREAASDGDYGRDAEPGPDASAADQSV